jgi:hypothetical protein
MELKLFKGGRWKIKMTPVPGNDYTIGVDTASGKEGANETVATILCVNTGCQDAWFGGIVTPEEMAEETDKVGRLFNNACIGVEKEYHGATVIAKLREKAYPNLYFHALHAVSFQSSATEYGWDPRRYRQTAIDWLQQDIGWSRSSVPFERAKAIWVYDPETISQLGWFTQNSKTGKYEAASGKYDDRVSALMIANFIRREKYNEVFSPKSAIRQEPTFLDRVAAGANRDEDEMELTDEY